MQTKSPLVRIAIMASVPLAILALFLSVQMQRRAHSAPSIAPNPTAAAKLATSLSPAQKEDWARGYANLPLAFEANQGQTASDVRFLSRGDGYSLFLTGQEAVLALRPSAPGAGPRADRTRFSKLRGKTRGAEETAVLRMRLDGANPHTPVAGIDPLPTRVNY